MSTPITATAALARAIDALRAQAEYAATAGHATGSSQIADALAIVLADVSEIQGSGACAPEDLVPFLRGLPPPADESRTWIRRLRTAIEDTLELVSADEVEHVSKISDDERARILAGFDRLLADATLAEERAAERIATFVEKVAANQRRYLVAGEAPRVLVTVAHDIRNGAWRKP